MNVDAALHALRRLRLPYGRTSSRSWCALCPYCASALRITEIAEGAPARFDCGNGCPAHLIETALNRDPLHEARELIAELQAQRDVALDIAHDLIEFGRRQLDRLAEQVTP